MDDIDEEIEQLKKELRAIRGGRRYGGLKDDIERLEKKIEEENEEEECHENEK